MNIQLFLKIKTKGNSSESFHFNFNTLLKPFYISEIEVLNIFFNEYNHTYFNSVRQLIFLNSIKADEMLGNVTTGILNPKDLLLLKKKLTTCLTIRDFGNKFNKDYVGSLTRSKSFAEFSVSTTTRNDPRFVANIVKDAEDCITNLSELIGLDNLLTPALGYTFVKGSCNPFNKERPSRLWHHGNLEKLSSEVVAFDKRWFNGVKYKNGIRGDLNVTSTRVED